MSRTSIKSVIKPPDKPPGTHRFSGRTPALRRRTSSAVAAHRGIRGRVRILKARVERRHRVVLRRLDVDLVIGVVLLLAHVRRSLRDDRRFDDGRPANHRTKRGLMQRWIDSRNQRFRGAGTTYGRR